MKLPVSIFFKSFVKPFYKENAGAIVFVFTMMFCIVSTMDGAGMLAYHYSLVTAMLTLPVVFLMVFAIWFLYARKCATFVVNVIRNPHFSFLHIVNCLSKRKRFLLFLFVNAALLIPILSYSLFIVYVGCDQHLYGSVVIVVSYLLLLCVASAAWHVSLLSNPTATERFSLHTIKVRFIQLSYYPFVILSFVANDQKAIWMGIKIYTCGVLYLIARFNSTTNYDTLIAFLFFNFGILAHGVLVYNIRQWEETYLSFYRGLPVPLVRRLLHYLLVYFILLLPEFVIALLLIPVHLHIADAVSFSLCAYSLLLLMNSILFLSDFSTKEFAIILSGVFCVQYIFLITGGYAILYLLFFVAAILLFLLHYYRFERNLQRELE